MRSCVLSFLLLSTTAVQAQNTQDPNSSDFDPVARMQRFYPNWKPPVVSQEELSKHPLGSEQRPIRTQGVNGQHAYLGRLRCENGKPPQYRRMGMEAESPYGFPMDKYEVSCGSSAIVVHMDLYHPGFVEREPISGFTLSDEH